MVLIFGCVNDDGQRFTPMDVVKPSFSDDDLRELGMDADHQIQDQVEIVYDPVVSGFLNELGQAIVREIEPQPFIYRFRVIKANSLNAFAIPAGYIYIHSETLLRVGSVDELAGVLAHEIAHIDARHFSRRAADSALPGLAARLAGMAAAVATQEPGLVMVGEGINVGVQLGFTRENEAEADQLGAIWMSRAGYEPDRLTRFLDRIVQSKDRFPNSLPPYLASHPFPEDRIVEIHEAAKGLEPGRVPDADLAREMTRAQARLALLMGTGRVNLVTEVPSAGSFRTAGALAEAKSLEEGGDIDGALLVLGRVDGEITDPRIPLRIGELLYEQRRFAEAAASFQRAIHMNPSHALVFFKLGLALRELGERHRAVYAFEQALLRSRTTSALKKRANWEIFKLTFGSIVESGFADGSKADETPAGAVRVEFSTGAPRLAWWARLGSRFNQYGDALVVRWFDPTGELAQEDDVVRRGRSHIRSILKFDAPGANPAGEWTVELMLENDVIKRQTVHVRPAEQNTDPPL